MDLIQILQRSLSGYIFLVPGLLLYFWALKKDGRQQPPAHVIGAFVFCYYLIGVLTMTGIGSLKGFSPRLVLLPFVDMLRGPMDTALNVVLFLPFGLFLGGMYRRYRRGRAVVFAGLLFSASIELVQMFGRGATDINDLITNTVGAWVGYLLYKGLARILGRARCAGAQGRGIAERKELLFFVLYAWVVMVTVQPAVIHGLFHLG